MSSSNYQAIRARLPQQTAVTSDLTCHVALSWPGYRARVAGNGRCATGDMHGGGGGGGGGV